MIEAVAFMRIFDGFLPYVKVSNIEKGRTNREKVSRKGRLQFDQARWTVLFQKGLQKVPWHSVLITYEIMVKNKQTNKQTSNLQPINTAFYHL